MTRRRALAAAVAVALCGVTLAVALTRPDDEPAPAPPQPTPPIPTVTPAPALQEALEARGRRLAVGITEPNANLVSPRADVPEPFARWRDALGRLHPAVYRLVLYWPAIQPRRDRPPDLTALDLGCLRDEQPCAAYGGVRAQVRALAARQREGGWEALVVVTGTPDWAARAPSGCERPGTEPRNRMPRAGALPAYRQLVAAVLAAARREGADLRYWAPWNEPNHPFAASPQRPACTGAARSLATEAYEQVARALRTTLAAAPGDQRYVVGELAGLVRRQRYTTTVGEFFRALPAELVCGAAAITQHFYTGGADVVDDVARAVAAKRCARDHAIWITETGAGAARTATARTGGRAGEVRGCRALHRQLTRWYRDPRVTVAVQYTLREDDLFPTGLVTTALDRAYPALAEWSQWGMTARPEPENPPPSRPDCR